MVVLTALPGQRAAACRGAQRSFLAGYEGGADPAAAGDPVVPLDPVVDVANVGLMVDVATAPTGEPGTVVRKIGSRIAVNANGGVVLLDFENCPKLFWRMSPGTRFT